MSREEAEKKALVHYWTVLDLQTVQTRIRFSSPADRNSV